MAVDLEGGCACGAVRYRLTSAPMFVHCCHCLDCQRQTGSAFVLNAMIETDRIELLQGSPEPVRVPTDSGRPHDIYRCPQCQTALWSDYGGRPFCASCASAHWMILQHSSRRAHLHPQQGGVGRAAAGGTGFRGLL